MRADEADRPNPAEGNEPRYVISIAARMLGTRTHTLRYYEKMGIIEPSRSRGNIRLYSQSDIERLKHMRALTSQLGVNLAGVEIIIRMAERMTEMQQRLLEMESQMERLRDEMEGEGGGSE